MRLRDTVITAALVATFTGAIIISTAATASAPPEAPTISEQAEELEQAQDAEYSIASENPAIYNETINSFPYPLPDAVVWPEELPSALVDPNMIYEEHSVQTAVGFYWMCSWSNRTLAAADAGDAEAVAEGIEQIGQFRDLPFLDLQDDDEWYALVVAPLAGGDFQMLRESTPAECGL